MKKKLVAITTLLAIVFSFGIVPTAGAASNLPAQDNPYPEGYDQKLVDTKSSIKIEKEEEISTKGKLGTTVKAIKKALEAVWDKTPNWIKGYVTLESLFEGLDLFIGISDTVGELITNAVEYAAPNSTPNWVITSISNIIIWAIPII